MKQKSFDSEELREILQYLDSLLAREDLELEIAIYGGAAVMLHFGTRSRGITEDVDAVIMNREQFGSHPSVFQEVAKRFDLAEDWINSNIINTISELKREDLIDFGNFTNIAIRLPRKEQLLAMKIKAARYFPKSDFADARQLIDDLGISTLEELREIVGQYIPQFLITKEVEDFLTSLMEV
jgi:hypothetical protein